MQNFDTTNQPTPSKEQQSWLWIGAKIGVGLFVIFPLIITFTIWTIISIVQVINGHSGALAGEFVFGFVVFVLVGLGIAINKVVKWIYRNYITQRI